MPARVIVPKMTERNAERSPRWRAWSRALLVWVIFGFALGTAGAAGDAIRSYGDLGHTATQFLRGLIVLSIAVPLIVLVRRRLDGRSMSSLGFGGLSESLRWFAVGFVMTAGCAAAVFGAGTAAGWLEWSPVAWPALLAFLAINTAVAFCYEAFPEELAFRGYVYGTLSADGPRWVAFLGTVTLFATMMLIVSPVHAFGARLLGDAPAPIGLAPAGEDPVSYIVLLAIFGSALLIARITTGSLWACIGLHLAFLTVNRIVLVPDTGWSARLTAPDAVLLIPVYRVLTGAIFQLAAKQRGWTMRTRDVWNPDPDQR